MSNGKVVVDSNSLGSLADELTFLGRQMVVVGNKIGKLSISQPKVEEVEVTPETDPDMFTKEFTAAVRKSRQDIKEGKVYDYFKIRKDLGLK